MSLADPTRKMSKSDTNANAFILLTDDRDAITRKFKRAVTDSDGVVRYDPAAKPGVSNLMVIYQVFTGKSFAEIEREFDGQGYGVFKEAVGAAVAGRQELCRRRPQGGRGGGFPHRRPDGPEGLPQSRPAAAVNRFCAWARISASFWRGAGLFAVLGGKNAPVRPFRPKGAAEQGAAADFMSNKCGILDERCLFLYTGKNRKWASVSGRSACRKA